METYQFTETILPGKTSLNLWVEIGRAEILPHDEPTIAITAEIAHMIVSVSQKENVVNVRVEQEKTDGGWLDKIQNWVRGEGPKANLTIYVPADCPVYARTVTGLLNIHDINAPVTTDMVTGNTELARLGSSISAKTITGKLSYEGILSDDDHRFEATTGVVQLRLPKEPNAQVDLRTTTGKIVCEYPLSKAKEESHLVGQKVRGTLGAGTGHLKAAVVTGKLQLVHA